MLKLKELKWSGIGRFVDEQTINFDSLGNLVQVDGKNNNTGGSSGAGKSTIFHALDYLFGVSDIPNTVLKCRYSDEPMSVKGTFDYDGLPLVVTRSKKLSIELDGKVTTGSSKITEEELDRILAIPRDLFRKMLHKRQKEGGFFLQMTPKDINDFLTDCLGLGEFKKSLEKLDLKVKELADRKVTLIGELESVNSALKATVEASALLGEAPKREVDRQAILAFKDQSERAQADFVAIQTTHRLEMETLELARPELDNKAFDKTAIGLCDKELAEVRRAQAQAHLGERDRVAKVSDRISLRKADLSKFNYEIQTAERVRGEASKVALEIKKIRESLCPTCEQTWATDSARQTEASLLDKIVGFKEQIRLGEVAKESAALAEIDIEAWKLEAKSIFPEGLLDLERKEKELVLQISQEKAKETDYINAQHHTNKTKLNQFTEVQKLLANKQSSVQSEYHGISTQARWLLDVAAGKLRTQEESLKRYEQSVASLKAQEASYRDRSDKLTLLVREISVDLAIAEELKRGVKSYLSCSFDEALETIGDGATKLIRNIPNMANATVQLSGTKETQDGKVKEEVNCVIHMDGEENVDMRSLCGGERTSLDLAIDLSVIDLIENKANKGINIFVLDEPFTGHDSECVEMVLEVLKNTNTNKKLVIVDHNPIVKEHISDRLLVTRDGLTSSVVQ